MKNQNCIQIIFLVIRTNIEFDSNQKADSVYVVVRQPMTLSGQNYDRAGEHYQNLQTRNKTFWGRFLRFATHQQHKAKMQQAIQKH